MSELFGELVKIQNPGPHPRTIDLESLELRSHDVWGGFFYTQNTRESLF